MRVAVDARRRGGGSARFEIDAASRRIPAVLFVRLAIDAASRRVPAVLFVRFAIDAASRRSRLAAVALSAAAGWCGSAILPTENVRELPSVTKSIPEQRIASDYAV